MRRLCAAVGLPVMALHRDAVGPVSLGALPESRHAVLGAADVTKLWADLGGCAEVESWKHKNGNVEDGE